MLTFSVIICTRDRPLLLERLLLGIALLRYPMFELIVICDPNDTVTVKCLAGHAGIKKIGYCAEANLAKARNIGLSMAQGDIAAFIDDDAVPEPDWLNQLASAYASPRITASGGVIRGQDGVGFQSRVVLIDPFGTDHHRKRFPPCLAAGWFHGLTGTNFSARRLAARAIGGFDENYPYFLEETDFLLRLREASGEISFVEDAEVHHGFAASARRSRGGAPKSLRLIARSKAYYCHINRRREVSPRAITLALAQFLAWKFWLIGSKLLTFQLNLTGAKRLLGELQTGLREGERLARVGRCLASFPAAAAPAFEPFQNRQTPRRRLCVLTKTLPEHSPEWPLILERAYHCEVTVIYFGGGIRHGVTFAAGVWQHRLAYPWRLIFLSSRAITGEIRRIAGHRRFEQILVASDDPALRKAAAASGLPLFSPPADQPTPAPPK